MVEGLYVRYLPAIILVAIAWGNRTVLEGALLTIWAIGSAFWRDCSPAPGPYVPYLVSRTRAS